MSEVNETAAAEVDPQVAAQAVIDALPADQQSFISTIIGMVEPLASQAVGIQTAIRGAEGGLEARIAEVYNNSDNEDIVAARTELETLDKKIEAAQAKRAERFAEVKAYIEANHLGDDEVDLEAEKKKFAEVKADLNGKIKAGNEFFSPEVFAAALVANGITIPGGLKRSSNTGTTGIKRPRLATATLDGKKVADKEGKTSFGILAAEIKSQHGVSVDVPDLQAAAFKAAGTDDLPVGTDVKFKYLIAGKKAGQDFSHEATIVVTAREK